MNAKMTKSEIGRLGGLKSAELGSGKRKHEKCVKDYESNPKNCLQCGNLIEFKKRQNIFCGHSCSAIFHNIGIIRFGTIERKSCEYCGNITKNKFCNNTCYAKYENKRLIEMSELGLKLVGSRRYRKYLIEIYGAKCMKCGWCEINLVSKNVPIQLTT